MTDERMPRFVEMNNRAAFIDFCQGLLNMNPRERWTPQQARQHPFITGEKWTKPWTVSFSLFLHMLLQFDIGSDMGPPSFSRPTRNLHRHLRQLPVERTPSGLMVVSLRLSRSRGPEHTMTQQRTINTWPNSSRRTPKRKLPHKLPRMCTGILTSLHRHSSSHNLHSHLNLRPHQRQRRRMSPRTLLYRPTPVDMRRTRNSVWHNKLLDHRVT